MKRFARNYKTADKEYRIGDLVEIEDEKLVEKLLENGTIKEFGDKKSPLEKKVEELEKENELLKAERRTVEADGVIVTPVSYKELSEMTHEELDRVDEKLGIKTEGNKEPRLKEIWLKLSEGYEAGADEEL